MRTKLSRLTSLVLSVLACTLLLGVARPVPADEPKKEESKVTRANADKIKNGMTVKEVEEILGPGKEQKVTDFTPGTTRIRQRTYQRIKEILDKGGKAYKWEAGRKSIVLAFADGKVALIQTSNLEKRPAAKPDPK